MSCESCINEARERMRDYDNIKQKAKQHAKLSQKAMAICKDETGAYFLTPAPIAIAEGCAIVEVIYEL